MRGATLALSWEIVARLRWLYYASGAYFVIACAVVALVPVSWRVPELGGWLAAPLLLVAASIPSSASYGEGANLRLSRSGFSRRLFTLPVSSFTLATVPFVMGAVLLASLWAAVVLGLLRPCGADVPLVLPALAITATVAWLQAVTWTPFPVPWVRMALLSAGCYGLLVGPFLLLQSGVDQGLISWVLAGVLVLCYLTSLVGVRLGRRGVMAGDRVQADRGEVSASSVPLTPFSSPLRAQLWLEWRWLGWLTFWQVLVMVLGFFPLLYMTNVAWSRPFMLAAVGPFAERMGTGWFSALVLLILPIACSMIGGDVSRHNSSGPSKAGMSPFFATRAIGTHEILQAKLLGSAAFVMLLWSQMVAVVLAWATATGQLGDMMERLGDLAGFPGWGVAVLAGMVAACCLVNWLWLIGNLWVGLSGRPWVSMIVMLVFTGFAVAATLVVKQWGPSWYPWLVAVVCLGLACKAVAVGWACRKLVARDFARPSTLTAILLGWGVVVAVLASVAAWVLPGGWLTFACIVLLMPLATSLSAPLALAWDRHR